MQAGVLAALAFAAVGYFLGPMLGFNALPSAVVLGVAGAAFGRLVTTVGRRACWLPAAGLVLGLVGMVVVQLVSGAGVAFGDRYAVFVPLLCAVALTLLGSVALLPFPGMARRLFRAPVAPH